MNIIKETITIQFIENQINNNYNINNINNIIFETINIDNEYDFYIKQEKIKDYLTKLPINPKIGLCIAGNLGKPGGALTQDYLTLSIPSTENLP